MQRVLISLLLLPLTCRAQERVTEIKVTGNARIAPAAVIAASGLHAGDTVTRADLGAAARRVLDTGFFSTVNYRYDPKAAGRAAGYIVTLQVTEEPATTPVELDIPGQDPDQLWQVMKSADGLIDRRIPGNERATAYYKHALEEALRKANYSEEITVKQEADLRTGTTMIICRPAHLPHIVALDFEGNRAISSDTLQAALAKVAMGSEYTERDFRRLLELNLRPRYEELGRLTVAFRSVRMASAGDHAVAITAGIDEGPVWRLGKVDLRGEKLPAAAMRDAAQFAEGAPANWKQFIIAVTHMEKVLRRDGYIGVSSRPVRNFRDGAPVVDVIVEVNKGPQFVFGELRIEGLDSGTQQRLAALWSLPAGAPMNEPYIAEFLHTVLPSLGGKVKSLHSAMHVRAGSNIVDVTIAFR